MRLRNQRVLSRRSQTGSFTIELAFVVIALWGIYLFAADLSYQLLVRAKLDRSSFALVNVIKERTRYFDADVSSGANLSVTNAELLDLVSVASRMLDTPSEEVAIKIESLTNKSNVAAFATSKFKSLGCQTDSILDYAYLVPVEKGVIYPLYRVSLCEEHRSWFTLFFHDDTHSMVNIRSFSIMPGR